MKQDIIKLLKSNPYPGRGIIIGCSNDGKHTVAAYFIMGRSINSRNRIFEKTPDGIRTAAYDASQMTDPSLIIYHPVRVTGTAVIITNGDQTDTIRDFINNDNTNRPAEAAFHEALQTRVFEPDAPNYTPRISAILKPDGSYALAVLKTAYGDNNTCQRCFYEYPKAVPGTGHFISTYEKDADPLPSFTGEPVIIDFSGYCSIETFTETLWDALNYDNKVSLYVRVQDIGTGEVKEIIKNKNS